MTGSQIYDTFGPEELAVSAACIRTMTPGSMLRCTTKDRDTLIAYTVIAVHRTVSTYLAPGAGLTLLSELGTYDNLLVRAGSPGRYVHLTLVVQ